VYLDVPFTFDKTAGGSYYGGLPDHQIRLLRLRIAEVAKVSVFQVDVAITELSARWANTYTYRFSGHLSIRLLAEHSVDGVTILDLLTMRLKSHSQVQMWLKEQSAQWSLRGMPLLTMLDANVPPPSPPSPAPSPPLPLPPAAPGLVYTLNSVNAAMAAVAFMLLILVVYLYRRLRKVTRMRRVTPGTPLQIGRCVDLSYLGLSHDDGNLQSLPPPSADFTAHSVTNRAPALGGATAIRPPASVPHMPFLVPDAPPFAEEAALEANVISQSLRPAFRLQPLAASIGTDVADLLQSPAPPETKSDRPQNVFDKEADEELFAEAIESRVSNVLSVLASGNP